MTGAVEQHLHVMRENGMPGEEDPQPYGADDAVRLAI